MRLIDADKLEATAVLGVQLQHADSGYYYFYEQGTIDNAPTVDAIPKQWLRELQTRYLKADCLMSIGIVNEIMNLWSIEKDKWEKENG